MSPVGHAVRLGLPMRAAVIVVAGALLWAPASSASAEGSTATRPHAWHVSHPSDPARLTVSDDRGALATFTYGARSVVLRGPRRVFQEPSTTSATVSTRAWVRLLPSPFTGRLHRAWLRRALRDRSPDVLAVAAEYLPGAPPRVDGTGTTIGGDASYGPLLADGSRQAGSDVNDYLGLTWSFGAIVDTPEAAQIGALDCSGYVRMVLGRRLGVPLTLEPDGQRLPRRAFQMAASGPGILVIPDSRRPPADLTALQPGDLVFSDVRRDDDGDIDHVGIYLGRDSTGAARFVSSRRTADGPTMGDLGGRSTLTGSGLYALGFRAARRV